MRTETNDNIQDFFAYSSDGFSYLSFGEPVKIKWLDIESIIAYKEDLVTVDEIRMTIVYNNLQLSVTEETPGWEKFILKIKSIFPGIPPNWDLEIVQPPFATNEIVLYKNDHYKISSYCWAMYLRILKRYVESGEEVPYENRLNV